MTETCRIAVYMLFTRSCQLASTRWSLRMPPFLQPWHSATVPHFMPHSGLPAGHSALQRLEVVPLLFAVRARLLDLAPGHPPPGHARGGAAPDQVQVRSGGVDAVTMLQTGSEALTIGMAHASQSSDNRIYGMPLTTASYLAVVANEARAAHAGSCTSLWLCGCLWRASCGLH